MNALVRFLREEEGVSAIEYGLMAALIALVMAVGAKVLGTGLSNLFNDIGAKLDGVAIP